MSVTAPLLYLDFDEDLVVFPFPSTFLCGVVQGEASHSLCPPSGSMLHASQARLLGKGERTARGGASPGACRRWREVRQEADPSKSSGFFSRRELLPACGETRAALGGKPPRRAARLGVDLRRK